MKRILFILLYTSLSIQGYSQLRFDYPVTEIEAVEYTVTYSHTYQRDSLADFKGQSDMYLFLGKKTSKFLSSELYSADTIMRNIDNSAEFQSFLLDRNKPFPKLQYRIWKNYPQEGKLTYIEHIPSQTYKYTESLEPFDWELLQETDTIQGYPSQKATCNYGGRRWVAWFTPEIAYSDGPYKFNGLPGLIIKLYDSRHHYEFEMVKIEKPDNELMIDITEKEYLETTKQKFFRAKDAFWSNIRSRAREAGVDKKAQQHAVKEASRRNNPIELKLE